MKTIAKWVVIIWSILSLIVICVLIFTGIDILSEFETGFEFLGGSFGLACFLSFMLLVWLAVAGPALLIYFVSGKKETTKIEIIESSSDERSN